MADFATINTGRIRHRYRSLGKTHTTGIRYDSTGDIVTALAAANVLSSAINELSPVRSSDWAPLEWTFAPSGSGVFLPLAGVIPYDAGALNPSAVLGTMQVALSTGFVGRSALGTSWRWFIYGCLWNVTLTQLGDYRISAAESVPITDAINALNDGNTSWVGIDNAPVTVYPYSNLNYNDKWIEILRAGS